MMSTHQWRATESVPTLWYHCCSWVSAFIPISYHLYHQLLSQEHIPIEEVFENLKCTEEGLSSDEVRARLGVFGYNKLEEKKVCCLCIFNLSPLL